MACVPLHFLAKCLTSSGALVIHLVGLRTGHSRPSLPIAVRPSTQALFTMQLTPLALLNASTSGELNNVAVAGCSCAKHRPRCNCHA